jgi:hypothetical protein
MSCLDGPQRPVRGHIAYSHDAPGLGGAGCYTDYAVQQPGIPVGYPS